MVRQLGKWAQIASYRHRNKEVDVLQQPTTKRIRVYGTNLLIMLVPKCSVRLVEMASDARSGADLYVVPRSKNNTPGYYGKLGRLRSRRHVLGNSELTVVDDQDRAQKDSRISS